MSGTSGDGTVQQESTLVPGQRPPLASTSASVLSAVHETNIRRCMAEMQRLLAGLELDRREAGAGGYVPDVLLRKLMACTAEQLLIECRLFVEDGFGSTTEPPNVRAAAVEPVSEYLGPHVIGSKKTPRASLR